MHYKRNNKESKTYVQGLRSFGNTLPRGVKSILKKNGYNYSEIISKWNFLMGKEISSYCYPKSIKMNKNDSKGTLVLGIERGDEINAEYSKVEIINKINSYFGYKLIDEVRLQTFRLKVKKTKDKINLNKNSKIFEKKINEIKNENIKNSLSALLNVYKND
ncbi:MAG TPA: DUF721 domain-containing protein [Candidatus Pelagibacter sp.]|jgi:hypothetical protein|nr:DUF721 domain-containing protein [Candidatus Pelagibacter sp.]